MRDWKTTAEETLLLMPEGSKDVTKGSNGYISTMKKDLLAPVMVSVNAKESKPNLKDEEFLDPWNCSLLFQQSLVVDRMAQLRSTIW